MSDTLITIVTVGVIVTLAFTIPMMATANQNDEITESTVQTIVEDFVNKEASKGKITLSDYNSFIQQLNSTGSTFDVDLEVQVMGDNVGVKGSAGSSLNVVGENIRHSEYTNTILNTLNSSEEQFILHKGDYFIVSVKNTNITLGKQLQTFFYQVIGKETSTINAKGSAMVSVTGVK